MEIRRGGDGPPRGPVLHIVVVGFHHKKGCQVEFSYPPLIPGDGHDSHTLPEEWKYLPFLALPDGAHNYQEDTVFFHLPPRNGNGATIYGISCYRQIEAKRTAEILCGHPQNHQDLSFGSELDYSTIQVCQDRLPTVENNHHNKTADDSSISGETSS